MIFFVEWVEYSNFVLAILGILLSSFLTVIVFNWSRKNKTKEDLELIKTKASNLDFNTWSSLFLQTYSFFDKLNSENQKIMICKKCFGKFNLLENWIEIYKKIRIISNEDLDEKMKLIKNSFALFFYEKLEIRIKILPLFVFKTKYLIKGFCYNCVKENVDAYLERCDKEQSVKHRENS